MDFRGTAFAYSHSMARVLSLDGDAAELAFDPDSERWPWLALPPQHPVVLEKYQYFASMMALWALKLSDPGTYGALVGSECEVAPGPVAKAHATHGTIRFDREAATYELRLRDARGELLATMRGRGHGFGDRDFKAFRAAARQKVLERHVPGPAFVAAPAAAVGLPANGVALVATLQREGAVARCTGLVTTDGGFHPRHPFHTGSGDHVNVGHMLDCALQVAHQLLAPSGALRCVSAASSFMRFLELDVPFELEALDGPGPAGDVETVVLSLRQVERECARIALRLRRVEAAGD